jgi:hypothetical protein
MQTIAKATALLMMGLLPSACMQAKKEDVSMAQPVMGWDHRPEAPDWTQKTLLAVAEEDHALAAEVPRDIAQWCPGYAEAPIEQRRVFWAGLISALAKHESTWNPAAAGGGGRWIGLTQISPRTAQQYGCEATSSSALKDGAANLSCAVDIAAVQVAKDDAVAGTGAAGMGRDWAPFRNAAKRAEMMSFTSQQSYCQKPV